MTHTTHHLHSTTSSAVIVGGSLSGLMTGIALAREGVNVTILGKVGESRGSGAGLRVDANFFEISKTARFLRRLVSSG